MKLPIHILKLTPCSELYFKYSNTEANVYQLTSTFMELN